MNSRNFLPDSGRRGVALVIVLAFVVLLTGLFVAFFSRAVAERQVSNGSANLTKTSLLAEGAADSIVSNLKQEIVFSSSNVTVGNGSSASSIYLPIALSAMLPQVSGTIVSGIASWSPNLLKRSANALTNPNFYQGSSSALSIPSVGIAISSTTPSLNGRCVSLARWNKHCLLSGTDPLMTPQGFAAPDWVLVARNGSNPVQNTVTGLTWSATNTNTVVGRYAYAIYHEGGLLDVNVVGYPQTYTTGTQSGYKAGLAYADLASIFATTGLSSGSASTLVDQIVGWRNYATLQASGTSLLNPNLPPSSGSNYYNFVLSNTTGFLTVSSTALNQGGSDHLFASRQELVRFFQSGLGITGTALNVLNYLTHFSRDLNQPTFIPGTARPGVSSIVNGGNDIGGGTEDNLSVPTTFTSTTVNPAFVSARVSGTGGWLRNDNTIAVAGEPLVKRRFALSRLAWLTYRGPSGGTPTSSPRTIPSSNPGASSPDYDMWQLVNTYGLPASFLQQGTLANIQKYFGLTWVQDNSSKVGINDGSWKWKYMHGTNVSGTGVASGTISPGRINTLGQVAALGREPDFFELLKAAVSVGSIAKPATPSGANEGAAATPTGYQNRRDASVDAAIIQLGANIIDQFDTDSYCTRIVFDDAVTFSNPQEYRGIEDVPYLYRLRGQHIKVTESVPPTSTTTVTGTFTSITNVGSGVYQLVPEIWNPHTWLKSGTSASGISPCSGTSAAFRIIALSSGPADNASLGTIIATIRSRNNGFGASTFSRPYPADPSMPPPFSLTSGTALTFTIPSARMDCFRESTILNKPDLSSRGPNDPGPPIGTQVTTTGTIINSLYKSNAYNGSVPNSKGWSTGTNYDNQRYIGFPLGTYPIWFKPTASGTTWAEDTAVNLSGATNVTVRMQYLDPITSQYVTYDEKFLPIPSAQANTGVGGGDFFLCGSGSSTPVINTYGVNTQYIQLIGGDNYCMVTDPRTSRFSGMVYTSRNVADAYLPPPIIRSNSNPAGWVDAYSNALVSARPDFNPGWKVFNPGNTGAGVADPPTVANATAMGFYNSQAAGSGGTYDAGVCAGLFAQNWIGATVGANNKRVLCSSPADDQSATSTNEYYSDPDGVVRRASGGYSMGPSAPLASGSNTTYVGYNGLPMQTASAYSNGLASPYTYGSRPVMLNRPFRSVVDLGYTFSGTPWKNVDFSTPESGFSALLDVFCVNDNANASGLAAGKVNINTRQPLVLQAILTGAYKDELKVTSTMTLTPTESSSLVTDASNGLLARTTSTTLPKGPLQNLSELVGKWAPAAGSTSALPIDGSKAYDGFSADLNNISAVTASSPPMNLVQRFHETAIRALANTGQTRVWNLLIDIVAQTGRYPQSASGLDKFMVEGEQHCWVHVAIDRYTGQVIDRQIEIVKE